MSLQEWLQLGVQESRMRKPNPQSLDALFLGLKEIEYRTIKKLFRHEVRPNKRREI